VIDTEAEGPGALRRLRLGSPELDQVHIFIGPFRVFIGSSFKCLQGVLLCVYRGDFKSLQSSWGCLSFRGFVGAVTYMCMYMFPHRGRAC